MAKGNDDSAKKEPTPNKAKCRDCGAIRDVLRWEFYQAATPRCLGCGGLLDIVSGPIPRRRTAQRRR